MGDFKPRPGTFLPYMEYAKREKLFEQRAHASALTLLGLLAGLTARALPLFELQSHSRMERSRYCEALVLKSLRDAACIAIEGEELDKMVRLTDTGAEVVRLTRPRVNRRGVGWTGPRRRCSAAAN
jgi:hypothetical protein